MTKTKSRLLTALLLWVLPGSAQDNDFEQLSPLHLVGATPEGAGCSNSNLVIVGAGATLSVLFSELTAVTVASGDAIEASAQCALEVIVQVEPGYSLSELTVDWRGNAYYGPDAELKFERELLLAGVLQYRFTDTWGPAEDDPIDEDFTLRDRAVVNLDSPCNGSSISVRIRAKATVRGADGQLAVDSADWAHRAIVHTRAARCE